MAPLTDWSADPINYFPTSISLKTNLRIHYLYKYRLIIPNITSPKTLSLTVIVCPCLLHMYVAYPQLVPSNKQGFFIYLCGKCSRWIRRPSLFWPKFRTQIKLNPRKIKDLENQQYENLEKNPYKWESFVSFSPQKRQLDNDGRNLFISDFEHLYWNLFSVINPWDNIEIMLKTVKFSPSHILWPRPNVTVRVPSELVRLA